MNLLIGYSCYCNDDNILKIEGEKSYNFCCIIMFNQVNINYVWHLKQSEKISPLHFPVNSNCASKFTNDETSGEHHQANYTINYLWLNFEDTWKVVLYFNWIKDPIWLISRDNIIGLFLHSKYNLNYLDSATNHSFSVQIMANTTHTSGNLSLIQEGKCLRD